MTEDLLRAAQPKLLLLAQWSPKPCWLPKNHAPQVLAVHLQSPTTPYTCPKKPVASHRGTFLLILPPLNPIFLINKSQQK